MHEIEALGKKYKVKEELIKAFDEIQMARTPFQLEHFVIGQHEGEEKQYAQCVLELQIKYNALRRAEIRFRKSEYELEQLKKSKDPIDNFDAEEKVISIEEYELATIGAMREFEALYSMWSKFETRFTRQEMNDSEDKYWKTRLLRQGNQDVQATGRIGKGNAESLRQIGMGTVPELGHIKEIEQRFIQNGNHKVFLAVATEHKAENGLPCLQNLLIPNGMQHSNPYNSFSRKPAEAYNDIALAFLKSDCDYLLTVEDDTFPPEDALIRLFSHIESGAMVVGAWYCKRDEAREGVPIIIKDNGKRGSLEPDDGLHEVYTLPMGCTLYSREIFYKVTFPYFVTTDCLSQDSFFSQKLRDAGYKLYCDTSIRCKHIDRETSKVYE